MKETQAFTGQQIFAKIDWLTVAFWGTVALAFWMRFFDLANMPLHHDESLYGTYCWRFFKGEGYAYDPMLHGPFMFHFQLIIFFLFGISDFSVRIGPALFGGLLVASVYLLKDWAGKLGMLAIALFITFSPTHLYYSRFFIHDSYSAFFTFAFAACGLKYWQTRKRFWLYLTAAALSIMFCIKANAYIHTYIIVTFLLVMGIFEHLCFRLPQFRRVMQSERADESLEAPFSRFFAVIRQEQYPLILAGFVFLWIYIILYTTVFTHPQGLWDGIYRTWTYWLEQHNMQRIKGPYHYYLSYLFLYEFPALALGFGGVLISISTTARRSILAAWATILAGILSALFGKQQLPSWFALTHMEFQFDLILTVYIMFIGLWGTLHFLARRERLTALFVYWSGLGFLIYAYAGEKVPWLFLHVLLPLLVLAGIMLRNILSASCWRTQTMPMRYAKYAASLVGILLATYTLHTTVLLNYYNRANPVERMVYTQTSWDVVKMLKVIEDIRFSIGSEEAKKPVIAVQGDATWPLAWYLRDYDRWFFPGDLTDINCPMVVINWEDREKYRETLQGYQEIRVKLREWWIPELSQASLLKWWEYIMYRKVFNPTGSTDIAFYIKR
ncbi:hypothetical protein U14_02277 [Candidatus Moduliflexus flocculans]|uniref:Glycosyltransferase RgtA/B/C/D-like domain-containing protein n=1 Tax=Candidatus Moduliflexus flocculans TaxID=1499966 RepID=A0A0S6VTZ4_9BACT|nr:hypothetical protein U14_02277 [Candidatus Moduliflexus flocculans]